MKSSLVKISLGAAVLGLLLSGCSSNEPPAHSESSASSNTSASPSAAETAPSDSAQPAATVKSMEDFDLANEQWHVPAYDKDITLVDGKASEGTVSYELKDVVYSDLDNDGVKDAAGQLIVVDGNAYYEHWMAWLAHDGGPVRIDDPIANGHNCGTVIDSVKPAQGGGVEVVEWTRNGLGGGLGEGESCAEHGPNQRIRTVAVSQHSSQYTGAPYLMQTSPSLGYGGDCPINPGGGLDLGVPQFYYTPDEKARISIRPTEKINGYIVGEASGPMTKDKKWLLVTIADETGPNGELSGRCAWVKNEFPDY